MISTLSPKNKLDAFILIFDELNTAFRKLGSPKLVELTDIYLSKIPKFLIDIPQKNKRASLEQGLKELPAILSGLPANDRILALKTLHLIVEAHFEDFFVKARETRERVFARGKIKTEKEFYLLRSRVDEIEREPSHEPELSILYKLLDEYEKIA